MPEALAAWHVRNTASHPDVNDGAKRVNHWSLGIEVVNKQEVDPFSAWQVEITARIVRHCWAKYPNLAHVVSHAKLDPDRRTDPGTLFDWSRFKHLVLDGEADAIPVAVASAKPLSELPASEALGCCHAPETHLS